MASRYCFVVDSKVRGYHVYKEIPNPIIGEDLSCEREIGKPHNLSMVAVKKLITGEWKIVGHVPRISPLSWVIIRGGGKIKCVVTGPLHYTSDLPNGGLEVPCQYTFSVDDAKKCELLHKRIIASLLKTCHNESPSSDVVRVIEARINEIADINELMSSGENATLFKVESEDTSNTSAMPNRCQNSHVEEVIVPEEIVCSPPKKQARFDEEQLLMGEELSDREIILHSNFKAAVWSY